MGKELRPPLHHGVVAIEKGAFVSPSTTVANFTLLYYCPVAEDTVSIFKLHQRGCYTSQAFISDFYQI